MQISPRPWARGYPVSFVNRTVSAVAAVVAAATAAANAAAAKAIQPDKDDCDDDQRPHTGVIAVAAKRVTIH